MAQYIDLQTIRQANAAVGRTRLCKDLEDEDWDCAYDSIALTDEYGSAHYSKKDPDEYAI